MSDSLTGIFNNPGMMNMIKAVTAGGGLLTNVLNSRKQGQVADQAIDHEKMVNALIANPALMAQKIAALKQPLSQGLVQDVTNSTQGQLSERGLGTSPQIAGAVESQALAPFEQKSQEDAINAFLGTLGMSPPSTNAASGAIPGMVDNSGFWNGFSPKPSTPPIPTSGSTSTGSPGSISTDPWAAGDPSL